MTLPTDESVDRLLTALGLPEPPPESKTRSAPQTAPRVLEPFELRQQQIGESAEFGAVFTDDAGETRSYAAYAPTALAAQEQLELDLPGYSKHEAIRRAVADKIEHEVCPYLLNAHGAIDVYIERIPTRLREARQSGTFGVRLDSGKPIVFWDDKAGLARLCPDDAREEAMRLRRRVQPALDALQADGHQLTYAVFTLPNFALGELRKGMATIFKRFRTLLRAKDADGELVFPQIKGALCVLEAPLGRSRDWNVHLNVILATRGFFDWKKLREVWHWNVELRKLPKDPGAIGGALTELIKYAVAATSVKSQHKADQATSPAPPMLEWTAAELLEWLYAMKGFRRTRTYAQLFRLKKPEKEDIGPVVWLGQVRLQGGRYSVRVPLLGSIPEDKSIGLSPAERWLALVKALKPDGVQGYSALADRIPRDAVHRSIEQLRQM